MHRIAHSTVIALALTAASLHAQERPLQVQVQQGVQGPQVVIRETGDANATRMRLHQLLRELPPAVGEVLQRDPSLMNRPDYLAPYPALTAFFQQHPEIA